MEVRRERAIPLGFFNSYSPDSTPKHLVDTIVEDLQVGEYSIKYRIRPVIFVRISAWYQKLTIKSFNPNKSGDIKLSDQREVTISKNDIKYFFTNTNTCRIVLIGEDGYSSFKIDFD